jgi:hypothetical protein
MMKLQGNWVSLQAPLNPTFLKHEDNYNAYYLNKIKPKPPRMQSEEFDKRLRDAAEHHHPAYNEEAWSQMEQLLDTHLPQVKKDRRRGFIFFLALFLLLGGGAWLLTDQPWNDSVTPKASTSGTSQKPRQQSSPGETNGALQHSITPDPGSAASATGNDKPDPTQGASPTNSNTGVAAIDADKQTGNSWEVVTSTGALSRNKKLAGSTTGNNMRVDKRQQSQETTEPVATMPQDQPVVTPPGKDAVPVTPYITGTNTPQTTDKKVSEPIVSEKTTEQKTSEQKKPAPRKKERGFVISASAGADLSGVGGEIGEVRPVVGIGLGYTFADRFTIKTGFYTASKVYTTDPYDYKFSSTPPNIQYLTQIDANCKVYEIPLSLSYSFAHTRNHNWFTTAGLSSYIMKKETYDYLYKYPGGATYTHTYTVNNENKHLFSALSLSGGYSRRLNNTFTLSAEPYIKIPLGGVGAGEVKLQGAGVLFSIGARLGNNK